MLDRSFFGTFFFTDFGAILRYFKQFTEMKVVINNWMATELQTNDKEQRVAKTMGLGQGARGTGWVMGLGWGLGLVMFWPGLAQKPWLWPGLQGLWLSKESSQAVVQGSSLAQAWPGLGQGFLRRG
jgi:hypothetical protein